MALRDRLIPDARQSWRFLSVQVNAGIAAIVAATTAAAPGLIVEVLRAPLLERIVVGVMVGAALLLTHWGARIVKQGGGDGGRQ